MKKFLLSVTLLALAIPAQAQITKFIWTGSTSNNWSTGSNWSGGSAPTTADVLFNSAGANGSIDISAVGTTLRNMYLYGGDYSLSTQPVTIANNTGFYQLGNGTFTLNNDYTPAGLWTFQGTGSGDIVVNGAGGNATAVTSIIKKYNTSKDSRKIK